MMDVDHDQVPVNSTGTPQRRWYEDSDLSSSPPFELQADSRSVDTGSNESARAFVCASLFPWTNASLHTLFNGSFADDEGRKARWRTLLKKWVGVVAVGGGSRLRFLLTRPSAPYSPLFTVEVPPTTKPSVPSIRCAAWCMVLMPDEFLPLVAFASNSILYIFDVQKGKFHGIVRGHGGQINHIAVHPWDPSIIITASHDYTCRIYDIRERVEVKVVNPCWPGQTEMAYGGPTFGLRSNDGEGFGFGLCKAILAGGPAGGHRAAVLSAAFHPNLPLIATSGMDHTVKIWQLPKLNSEDGEKNLMIRREDKPLFSSSHIHMSEVLSISWMGGDMLLSHSGPVIMREKLGQRDESHLYPIRLWKEPGTMVLWRWLGLNRFFPASSLSVPEKLRGCAADYQESSSFKIISAYRMPGIEPTQLHLFSTPSHVPLIVFPGKLDPSRSGGVICMSSLKHFQARKRPPFPDFKDEAPARFGDGSDSDLEELTQAAGRMTTADVENNDSTENPSSVPKLDTLPVWKMQVEDSNDGKGHTHALNACIVGENGGLLVGVGGNEGIRIFRIPKP